LQANGGGAFQEAPRPRRRIRLSDCRDIRRELASVYRDARHGSLAVADASRLASVLDILRRAIEADDLEQRLERLEQRLEPEGPTPAP
jgi:hypothetical protein